MPLFSIFTKKRNFKGLEKIISPYFLLIHHSPHITLSPSIQAILGAIEKIYIALVSALVVPGTREKVLFVTFLPLHWFWWALLWELLVAFLLDTVEILGKLESKIRFRQKLDI
jgi:hypothetical protein